MTIIVEAGSINNFLLTSFRPRNALIQNSIAKWQLIFKITLDPLENLFLEIPLWQNPAGPQTVFLLAPIFKLGLVIAGLGDLRRPAENSISLSSYQAVTGLIWSRYKKMMPKNWSLFVATTALYQSFRYKMEQDKLLEVIKFLLTLHTDFKMLSILINLLGYTVKKNCKNKGTVNSKNWKRYINFDCLVTE